MNKMTCLQYYARCGKSIKKKTIVTVHEKKQVFFHFFEKLGFSGTDRYKKEKNRMQKTKSHYLKHVILSPFGQSDFSVK